MGRWRGEQASGDRVLRVRSVETPAARCVERHYAHQSPRGRRRCPSADGQLRCAAEQHRAHPGPRGRGRRGPVLEHQESQYSVGYLAVLPGMASIQARQRQHTHCRAARGAARCRAPRHRAVCPERYLERKVRARPVPAHPPSALLCRRCCHRCRCRCGRHSDPRCAPLAGRLQAALRPKCAQRLCLHVQILKGRLLVVPPQSVKCKRGTKVRQPR